MAPRVSFVVSGLLLVIITIVVQSIPIDISKETVQSPTGKAKPSILQSLIKSTDPSPTTTVSPSSASTEGTIDKTKKKRYIDDDQLDAVFGLESDETDADQIPSYKSDDEVKHTLHANVKESSASIHDDADKPVNTDDSNVFSDSKMTPDDLTDVVRRRRSVKSSDDTNRRRKRALSPYDFYDTDAFYNPYARPARSFAPLYWYPTGYTRSIRSALAPSYYELSDLPTVYSGALDSDEIDENPLALYNDEDGFDDENNYESNRYPVVLSASDSPLDNLQLQQQYNTDDLPIDEDMEGISNVDDDDEDDDEEQQQQYDLIYQRERPSYTLYGPIEDYFR